MQIQTIHTNTYKYVQIRTKTCLYIPEAGRQSASCSRMHSATGASYQFSCGILHTDNLCTRAAFSTPHLHACFAQTACFLWSRFRLQVCRLPAAPVKHFGADTCELCRTKTVWGTCTACTSGTRHSKTHQPQAGRQEGLPRKCSFASTIRQPTGES